MRQYTTQQHGYTLIELLLYVTIVGALLIAVASFMAISTSARVKNQSMEEVNQQGIQAIEMITQTVRNGNAVTLPVAGASGDSATVTSPGLTIASTTFGQLGSALYIKEGIGLPVALTNDKVQVSNLTFKNLSRPSTFGIMQVSFTLSRVNPSNKAEYSYQRTFTTSAGIRPW